MMGTGQGRAGGTARLRGRCSRAVARAPTGGWKSGWEDKGWRLLNGWLAVGGGQGRFVAGGGGVLEGWEGGVGGSGTQKFVYHKWPDHIFPIANSIAFGSAPQREVDSQLISP